MFPPRGRGPAGRAHVCMSTGLVAVTTPTSTSCGASHDIRAVTFISVDEGSPS